MGKRGPKPKRTDPPDWSAKVAYAMGLFATDGCLSNDGRHIDLTSKDVDQLENFKICLGLTAKISSKISGYTMKETPRIQFSDVTLYKFLEEIGFTTAKTKTINELAIPPEYYYDFLRGHHDGDGSFYSYWDKRWKSSFMYYLCFVSASKSHIKWIRKNINDTLGSKGSLVSCNNDTIYQLKYAKSESLEILKKMYSSKQVICLERKRLKIEQALSIVGERL